MNCEKCGSLVDNKSNYCPYCGETLNKDNNTSTYQDPFAAYREQPTHQEQYQYQNSYSSSDNKNKYTDDLKKDISNQKDNKCLIGLIISILAIFLCFFHIGLGIAASIIAFVLVIVGFKHTTKGMKIGSLIVSIISLVSVLIISIFMFVFSLEITLDNGYRISIGNYFKSAFFNGYNSDEIEGYWISQNNELFYLDDNNYYLYMDASNLNDNYFTGTYTMDYGCDLENDTIFKDDDYYYYTLKISNSYTEIEEDYASSIKELLEGKIIIKIDNDDFDSIILEFVEENKELELVRY